MNLLHLVVLAAAWCALPAAAQGNAPVKVEVDAQRGAPMPELMRAGVFTFKPEPPEQALRPWLAEMRPGVVEIDIGGRVFQQAEDAEDVLQRTRALLPLLKRIRAAGGEPLLAITRIPLWLSSRPGALETVEGDVVPKGSIVAPRDGNEWASLVARFTAELKQGLGRTPDIKIGWEPDQSAWQGTEAEFFAFYRDTARGVKRADPAARVGGPSVSALYNGKGGESAPPMLPRFLRYAADTPVAELRLGRLPVDFVVWHQFGTEPVLAWDMAARQVRAWLKDSGYPETTPLLIGEWSSWYAWPKPASPEQDQPALAAYIVASMAAMQRAGIARAAFTSLVEQREVEGQPFIGSFGLFTNQFIKKPSYWAFQALGRLGGTQLPARSADPLVSVIAGKPSEREVAVLVAVSTPNERSLQRTMIAKALAAGVSVEQLKRDLDSRQIEGLASGDVRAEDLRAGDEVKRAIASASAEVAPLARRSRALRAQPRSVSVELAGFDAAGAGVEIWRIDSRHANAYALRERIGSYLQQRLAQEKQALPQGLTRRLEQRGYKPGELESFKQVMNARNRERALASRAAPERRTLRAMADESQDYIHERLAAVGQEINAWPELQFRPDDRPPARQGNRIDFEIEDDAVVLLRVIRR